MEYKAIIHKDIFTKGDRKFIDECMKNQPFTFDDIVAFPRTDAWWYCVIVYFCDSVGIDFLREFMENMSNFSYSQNATYRMLAQACRCNEYILINADTLVDVNNVVANLIREYPNARLAFYPRDKNYNFTAASWAVFVKQNIKYIFDVPDQLKKHPTILNALYESKEVIGYDSLDAKLPNEILDILNEKLTSRMSAEQRTDFIKKINACSIWKLDGKLSLYEYCDLIKSHEVFTFKPLEPRFRHNLGKMDEEDIYLVDDLYDLIHENQICNEVLLYLLLKYPHNYPLYGKAVCRLDVLYEICFDKEQFRIGLVVAYNTTKYYMDDMFADAKSYVETWYYRHFGYSIWCERIPNYVCDTTFFKTDPKQQHDAIICQAAVARDISNLRFVKCDSDYLVDNIIEHYPDNICDLPNQLNVEQLNKIIAKGKLTPEIIDKHRTQVYKINPDLVKNMTDEDWLSVIFDDNANIPELRKRDPLRYKRLLPNIRVRFKYPLQHYNFSDIDIRKELLDVNPGFICDKVRLLEDYVKYIGAWHRSLLYSESSLIKWLQINVDYIFFDGEPKSIASLK